MTLNDIAHKLDHVSEKLADLERQKTERLRIMKYANVDEEHLDRRDLILDQLDGKIRELDVARSRLIRKKGDQEKHFRQLKEGKITELPENIRTYMEQNGIDLVYGMEWLSKNGRTAEENAELVKKNPFIPYSILMERSFLERFQKNGEELYTSFPIPIIVKEELEQEQEHVDSRFAAYGNVHFYVMFNTHLLDREELEKILGKIRREIEDLKKAVEDKDADLETYRSYRSVVENQTFSTALCQQTEKEINRLKDERTAVKGRLEEIYREQSRLEEEKKEIETLADTVKEQIDGLKRMDVQFEILLKKYDQYETDRTSLERLKKENRELTEKQTALSVRLGELREQEMGLRALVKEFAEKIDREEKKKAEFEEIARTAENRDLSSLTQMTSEELEARYYALTKVISDSVEELRKSQTD